MLTLDLKKSNNHDIIQGKLILNISTNVNAPIRNGTNTLASGSRSIITRNPSSQSISVVQPPQAPPPPHSAPVTNASNTAADNAEENRNSDLPEG